jgi:hypothetical protein
MWIIVLVVTFLFGAVIALYTVTEILPNNVQAAVETGLFNSGHICNEPCCKQLREDRERQERVLRELR